MKNWIRRTSLVTKLRATALGTALVVLTLCGYLLWMTYVHSRDDRLTATRQAVQTAYSVLVWAQGLEASGALSREQAQAQARAAIKQMRYSGNEYFWLQDTQPRMVMHPIKHELDGKDLSDIKDADGVYLFKEFVRVTQGSGEGFVNYLWPKPGHDAPQPKQSYVMAFKPWAG